MTEPIALGVERLDTVAHCFAKRGTEVSKTFYIHFFSNREAARLSWKCVNLFTTVSEEELEAVDLREKQPRKLHVPSAQKILKWYQEHKNSLNISDNADVSDKGLECLIKLFTDERMIREDVVSSCDEETTENATKISTKSSRMKTASPTITKVQKDADSNVQNKKLQTKKQNNQKNENKASK